jgi:uncharacterized delta-60 repeat protein
MRALLIAALVALAPAASALAARPGTLDRSFGGDGRVETLVPGGEPAVAGVKALVGGRPLAVGTVGERRVVALRYHRKGRLDRRYGDRGVVSLDLGAEVTVGAVRFLREGNAHLGRMLIAGGLGPRYSPDRVAFVARVSSDGSLDRSFGEGGIVRTDLGGRRGDTVTDLAIDRAGRIVATVNVHHGEGDAPPYPQPQPSYADIGVARYDSNGRLDPSFGQGGIVRIAPDSREYLIPRAVAVQGERILIGGSHESVKGIVSFALRLLADGSPDPGFGRYGLGLYYLPGDQAVVRDLRLDPVSGRILLAGSAYDYRLGFYLAELPPEPPPESAASVTFVTGGGDEAWGDVLVLDGRRRRILGGSVWTPDYKRSMLGVARVLPDGRLDRCFGRRGVARVGFRRGPFTLAALDLDGRGRIVAAGPADYFEAGPRPRAFRLIRLWGGPAPGSSRPRTSCGSL